MTLLLIILILISWLKALLLKMFRMGLASTRISESTETSVLAQPMPVKNRFAELHPESRLSDQHRHLVVVNPSPHYSQGRIPLGSLLEGSSATSWPLTDLLDGHTYDRDMQSLADPGLHVILQGFQSHVFAFEALAS